MAKYRKRPVVVDAEQYTGPDGVPAGHELPPAPDGVKWHTTEHAGIRYAYVVTAHDQATYLRPGDWVIAEPDGRGHYPCKPDIFAATFDPAESATTPLPDPPPPRVRCCGCGQSWRKGDPERCLCRRSDIRAALMALAFAAVCVVCRYVLLPN